MGTETGSGMGVTATQVSAMWVDCATLEANMLAWYSQGFIAKLEAHMVYKAPKPEWASKIEKEWGLR